MDHSPTDSPVISRNTSYEKLPSDEEYQTKFPPIPSLHWWNPRDWWSIIWLPLNPTPEDIELHNWAKFVKWKRFQNEYRGRFAREFARFLILPTSLLNMAFTIWLSRRKPPDEDDWFPEMDPPLSWWRWLFLLIPFSQEVLGDVFFHDYPFLLKLIRHQLGFITAIIPLSRLFSPSMSLWTCLWCWYFSFLNSLVLTSTGRPEVKDRWDLCRKAFSRSLDYIKWPLLVVWIGLVLLVGPVLTMVIVSVLVVKILVGRIRELSYAKKIKFFW